MSFLNVIACICKNPVIILYVKKDILRVTIRRIDPRIGFYAGHLFAQNFFPSAHLNFIGEVGHLGKFSRPMERSNLIEIDQVLYDLVI